MGYLMILCGYESRNKLRPVLKTATQGEKIECGESYSNQNPKENNYIKNHDGTPQDSEIVWHKHLVEHDSDRKFWQLEH